ncbi:MAG: FAD-dependent oxidoreductase [Oscillospiraceae bacterium]
MAAREKIVLLAQKIRGKTLGKYPTITEDDPEYYCLAPVVTDEMAEVALGMTRREYISAEKLAPICGKSVAKTQELLLELEKIGVIESRTTNGFDEFSMPIYVPGIFEFLVLNKEQVYKYPEMSVAFEQFTRERIAPLAPNMPLGNGAMRVIPVETAISGETRKATYEEITYWLDKYNPSISVGDCQCRRSRRLMGEGCGHKEEELCIIVGETAESCIRTGRTRRITKEEALDIIKKAEEKGYMHQVTNMDGPDKIFAICNCCICSCFALRTSQYFNSPNMSRSNYIAKIDKEKCVACGQCVETCPSNAVKMGQKLCTNKPIRQKETILPDDHKWTEANWNPDFRNNRQDVVETGTAPCKTACPAHIAVQGYIKLASLGKYTEALELIKKENPFPAICGRICPHGCESECTRGSIDQPIAIDEIKKFIADKDLNADTRFIPKQLNDYSCKKIAIVGSGPAGLSCAYYLALDGYSITVFEKQEKLGGMMTLGIPAFRLEKEVINAEIDILRQLGVQFKTGVEIGRDLSLQQLRDEGFEGFYLAIGAQAGRKLGLEGEDTAGVISGIDFLRNVNLGKGAKLKGKVVVIGGGNVAIDVARTATRQGAEIVNMFCLEGEKEMPALPEEIEEACGEGININNGWGPKRIITKDGEVVGVEFKKCVSVFENGAFAPKYNEDETLIVDADFVLISVGQTIDWGKLLEGTKVQLGRGNTAIADPVSYQTKEEDIFVGGDVFTGPKFAIDAIAAGKQGANSVHRFVWGHDTLSGRDRRHYSALDKNNLNMPKITSGFDNTPRQKAGHSSENEKSFRDTRETFTEEQMKRETLRCLGCGASIVDENRCLGCGLCTTKCKFDAISLTKVFDAASLPYEQVTKKVAARMLKRQGNILVRKIKDIGSKKD